VAPDIDRILRRGRLVVAATRFEVAGFVMTAADGRLGGYDFELTEGMAKAMGVSVEFSRTAANADEIIDMVARGEADFGVSKLSATLERALQVRFSRPYLTLHQALLVNRPRFAQVAKGRDPVDAVNDAEAVIAIVGGTAYRFYAQKQLPRARLKEYPRWDPEILDAVLHGDVLAAYGDEIDVRRALTLHAEAPLQLRASILPDSRDPIAIAVPWNSTQLLAWVDLYLETTATSVTADELLAK
jgi:ABC-type amino acid transport substrate-binding protein